MNKTLLTLNRHTENSEEEAAMTLLDLSSEPVASSGEPDDKNMQEFKQGKRDSVLDRSSLKSTQRLLQKN